MVKTIELGKVKEVDPLGITYFRMRGMWYIQHPLKVFDYIEQIDSKDNNLVTIYALMTLQKYLRFDRDKLIELTSMPEVKIFDKIVKNPNNPANIIDSKLIKICF